MIQRIKSHNRLNGFKFSIAEFVLIALLISPFAVYYVLHVQVLYALASVGILLNCLTAAAIGLRQWFDKEQEIGWRGLQDKKERDRISAAHPHLLRDTTIITVTALAPYVLTMLAIYELLTPGRERRS